MRNILDFSSWQGLLTTLVGLVLFTLVAVGVRLLIMQRVQQRRERQNRQINERLKTLIAAYKTLGGSFTGDLAVDPRHLRELRALQAGPAADPQADAADATEPTSERRRRTRDAVQAALSDVILLGTAEQVELAVQAVNDMVAGRRVETAALVVSLRNFIREVLELEPVPAHLAVPRQGPLRTSGGGGRTGGGSGGKSGGGGGDGGMGGGGIAAGGAMGFGAGRTRSEIEALPGEDIPSP
ncbi:hypothetical protein DFR36_102137 [Melaminivora alkalimesophila]|uniref:Uncharacterized protein n=1 Tax=Melaminivora alkalimesophila TaxID=1165852 RepID=A0A317RDV5_9BURK|nr:hypothetical protein [Melaminivora alkalimesophila]PWW47761.1 hypothetical protein DFR36_102137 [Melaminivora alkalimesophila]